MEGKGKKTKMWSKGEKNRDTDNISQNAIALC